jgi:hypothetical protein
VGTPPDWSEPVALRSALTALGARRRVTPVLLAELVESEETISECWPAGRLTELVDALADSDQVLLYFLGWQKRGSTYYWVETPKFEVDFHGPWRDVVTRSRVAARRAAAAWIPPANSVVMLEWIDQSDL